MHAWVVTRARRTLLRVATKETWATVYVTGAGNRDAAVAKATEKVRARGLEVTNVYRAGPRRGSSAGHGRWCVTLQYRTTPKSKYPITIDDE